MKEQSNIVAVATTMTSLQIAEVTGKHHRHILRAIRSMEPAWIKTTGENFSLSEYTDSTGRRLPMYTLTKTECLYIATKFNDEARAKLVLRWEALEQERLNVSIVNERHNQFLAKALETAKYYNEKMAKEKEWAEKRSNRLLDKIILERKHPRFDFEQVNMETLLKGFDECIDMIWDCVGINNDLSARISMLEKKLGMYGSAEIEMQKGGSL